VRGPAVVLGAAQRAGRVVELDACARLGVDVFRRATTGTAVHLGGAALLFTLALPNVAALHPDATARSLLNRNVRGFLRGFEEAGIAARYFGREWISLRKRPGAIVGYDVAEKGAVLFEVLACWRGSFAIPPELAAAEERALDRYGGVAPVALAELLPPDAEPLAVAEAVLQGLASRAQRSLEPASLQEPAPRPVVSDPRDPIPDGLALASPVRVPIGWIDRAADRASRRVWIGGDMLTSASALRAVERAASASESSSELPAAPLDGARPADLEAAARALLSND
jgi:hypothetical protein